RLNDRRDRRISRENRRLHISEDVSNFGLRPETRLSEKVVFDSAVNTGVLKSGKLAISARKNCRSFWFQNRAECLGSFIRVGPVPDHSGYLATPDFGDHSVDELAFLWSKLFTECHNFFSGSIVSKKIYRTTPRESLL